MTIGSELLDDVAAFVARFVSFPSPAHSTAVTLWAAHTHLLDVFDSTPRLAVLSPEPGSGKTRVLEVLELLVPRPILSMNATPAYLFRKVADPAGPPTILFDEVDTVFGPRAKDNEDLRGLLNAGHRRGATAGRCVVKGKVIETEELPAYAAVAMAGLGDLPDTLMSRSVVIRMRRRAPGETVEPFRRRVHEPAGVALHDRLGAWAALYGPGMVDAWPVMPDGIVDRNADVWEPLLMVADAVGCDWPERARCDAVTLVTATRGDQDSSLGVRLLADVRTAFAKAGTPAVFTTTLLDLLHEMDEAPWGDLRGKPLDSRGLARRLGQYEVKPGTVRIGDITAKGYSRVDLLDAWSRYLSQSPNSEGSPSTDQETQGSQEALSLSPLTSVTSVTTSQCRVCGLPLDPVLINAFDSTHPGCAE